LEEKTVTDGWTDVPAPYEDDEELHQQQQQQQMEARKAQEAAMVHGMKEDLDMPSHEDIVSSSAEGRLLLLVVVDGINSLVRVQEGLNIVRLYEVYKENADCTLIMELMRGGELFERILEKRESSK
jgi:serine/threonine protein kinase